MELRLTPKYRIKTGEERQFLTEDEQLDLDKKVGDAVQALPNGSTRDAQVAAARAARNDYLQRDIPADSIAVRLTRFLLTTAVNLRYQTAPGQSSIPRKAEGKSRPGVWWGQIHDDFEKLVEVDGEAKVQRTTMDLDPVVMTWLVFTVWYDDKVQNGFPPPLQYWMNVFEEDVIEPLADELAPNRRKDK